MYNSLNSSNFTQVSQLYPIVDRRTITTFPATATISQAARLVCTDSVRTVEVEAGTVVTVVEAPRRHKAYYTVVLEDGTRGNVIALFVAVK